MSSSVSSRDSQKRDLDTQKRQLSEKKRISDSITTKTAQINSTTNALNTLRAESVEPLSHLQESREQGEHILQQIENLEKQRQHTEFETHTYTQISMELEGLQSNYIKKEALNSSADLDSNDVAGLKNKLEITRYLETIEYFSQYPENETAHKNIAKAHFHLAEIYEKQAIGESFSSSNNQDALIHYAQALAHNKELIEVYDKLGNLFYKHAEYERAITCYKVLNDFLHINKCFKAWLTEEEDNPEIWLKRGDYHLSIGQTQKAAEYYHNAFGTSKDVSSKEIALNKKAEALAPSDETTAEFRATTPYSESQTYHKNVVQIHLYLAEILEERKISSNASCSYYDIIAHYSQVILHDKGLIAIYNKLGDLFYKAKDYNKAILCYKVLNDFLHINKCFKAWLTEEEDNPEIWLKRGDYHLSICQTQKAAEYYHNAFGASKDVSSKEIALNKKAKALSPSDETTAEFRAAIQAHNCYNFPSAGDEFSTQILGVENDIHTES